MILSDDDKAFLRWYDWIESDIYSVEADDPEYVFRFNEFKKYKVKETFDKNGFRIIIIPELFNNPLTDQEKKDIIASKKTAQEKIKMRALIESIDNFEPILKDNDDFIYLKNIVFYRVHNAAIAAIKDNFKIYTPTLVSYPRDITRLSPFYPLAKKQQSNQALIRKEFIESSWGAATIAGPILSTRDEDILMVLLSMMQDKTCKWSQEITVDMKSLLHLNDKKIFMPNKILPDDLVVFTNIHNKTYNYTGPILPILNKLGYKHPNKIAYNMLKTSLFKLMLTIMELQVYDGHDKNDKRKVLIESFRHIVTEYTVIPEKKYLSITLDPFFYQMFCDKRITIYNLDTRLQIQGSVAKAIFRFITSHEHSYDFLATTLCKAINVDTTHMYQARRLLKKGIDELIQLNVLNNTSELYEKNNRTYIKLVKKRRFT